MILLTGHRGVGKTTFLRLTQNANLEMFKDYSFYDLDEEVQHKTKKTISHIFTEMGEKKFRELEQATLAELAQENVMISVGAGCNLDAWKNKARIIWLKRVTDANGRIFLNRPRLKNNVSEWEESIQLFKERDPIYAKWAHQAWYIPEALEDLKKTLPMFWQRNLCRYFEKGIFTVYPDSHTIHAKCTLELRDDLLTDEQIQQIVEQWPQRHYMISFRHQHPNFSLIQKFVKQGSVFDWDVNIKEVPAELMALPDQQICLSSHDSTPPKGKTLLKWAPYVTDWQELMQGHEWRKQDPAKRAFFPRSLDGRWQWYRELFSKEMPFYFFREAEGSATDQPFWWQRELLPEKFESFAAVLGNPVKHSWTPATQRDFFNKYSMPVVAISITEEEWSSAISVLEKLGLKAAAVTSPLKKLSAEIIQNPNEKVRALQACNTLFFNGKKWLGTNTDVDGVSALKQMTKEKNVVVWGSGAMAATVKAAWPEVRIVAQRTGQSDAEKLNPDVVVWSVGRSRHSQWPPKHWKPKLILDLNYMEDSPGREFAKMVGTDYVSGEAMFFKQAAVQQIFWQEVL